MKRSVSIVLFILIIGSIILTTSCSVSNKGEQSTDETITLTWYMKGDAERMSKLEAIEEIERRTGIHIEFIAPAENEDDSFKLMLASGDLPDIIQWKYETYPSKGSVNSLYLDGIAVELTDLVKQYAPNLTSIYQKRQDIYNEVLTLDGKLLYFPSINPMQTREEIARKANTGLIMRSDWLENLSLEVPDDIEDWYTVLSAFKNGDPNKNGIEDETPFDGSGIDCFIPAFGVVEDIYIKDGKVAFGPVQQEYKDFLSTMKIWYDEGLLGESNLTASSYWLNENIRGNITGSFKGLDNAWSKYIDILREKDPEASLVAVPWPKAKNGIRYTGREDMATHLSQEITIITNDCKYPEKAVELIDFLYSEEGDTLMHWGIEGKTYEVVDGQKKLLEEVLVKDPETKLSIFTKMAIPYQRFPKYNGEVVVHQLFPEGRLEAELVWADSDNSLVYPPTIILSQQDATKVIQLRKEIDHYVSSMRLQYITGLEPLNNFDEFVENLSKLGLNEILEIYQRNYEIYQKRMNRITNK